MSTMPPNPTVEPVLTTTVEPATMTPMRRWVRTVFQVLLAVGAAIPSAVALLDLPAETVYKVTGMSGAAVLLVSAAHNAFNQQQAKPELRRDRGSISLVDVLVVLAIVVLIVWLVRAF